MTKLEKSTIDLTKIDSVEVEGIDTRDYPDFTDAFISYAELDGKPLTEDQLNDLNEDRDFVYEEVLRHLF